MNTLFIILFNLLTTFTNPQTINPERVAMLDRLFILLEENIANPEWLETESFKAFKEDLYSKEVLKMSDSVFLSHFKTQRKTLDFSHFNLELKTIQSSKNNTEQIKVNMNWSKINDSIAYIDVRTFATDATNMIKIISEIGTDQYAHLIIDLRDNGGGSLDAPVVLGRFLTQDYIDAGVYLTRKWFLKEARPANKEDILKMPYLKEFTYQAIGKMYQEEAAFRMVLPPHQQPIFKGKVYVLINNNTASACEPLINLLQKKNIATLVGTKSAGEMLTGQYFNINDDYKAFIPIADYQTAEADRLDQKGVAPDYEVNSNEALNYVLENLIGVPKK